MRWDVCLLFAPIIGVVACGLSHLAYNWLTRGRWLPVGFLFGIFAGLVVQLVTSLVALHHKGMSLGDTAALTTLNLFTYLAVADGYVHSVNIMISSLRIRVLHELLVSNVGLTESDLLSRYNARKVVETRLRRLTEGGHLREEEGRFFLTPKARPVLLLGHIYSLLKTVLLGK